MLRRYSYRFLDTRRVPLWALLIGAFVLGFCAGEARVALWLR